MMRWRGSGRLAPFSGHRWRRAAWSRGSERAVELLETMPPSPSGACPRRSRARDFASASGVSTEARALMRGRLAAVPEDDVRSRAQLEIAVATLGTFSHAYRGGRRRVLGVDSCSPRKRVIRTLESAATFDPRRSRHARRPGGGGNSPQRSGGFALRVGWDRRGQSRARERDVALCQRVLPRADAGFYLEVRVGNRSGQADGAGPPHSDDRHDEKLVPQFRRPDGGRSGRLGGDARAHAGDRERGDAGMGAGGTDGGARGKRSARRQPSLPSGVALAAKAVGGEQIGPTRGCALPTSAWSEATQKPHAPRCSTHAADLELQLVEPAWKGRTWMWLTRGRGELGNLDAAESFAVARGGERRRNGSAGQGILGADGAGRTFSTRRETTPRPPRPRSPRRTRPAPPGPRSTRAAPRPLRESRSRQRGRASRP